MPSIAGFSPVMAQRNTKPTDGPMAIHSIRHLRARVAALHYKAFVRGLSGIAPYYLVNEFPKCGGTWLAQMLAMALDLPFRRNQPIKLEKAIVHGHFCNPIGLRNVVVLWRDPRDMLVSFYFHCFFMRQHGNELFVDMMRERAGYADFEDVRANMPRFLELIYGNPVSPRFTWPEFATVWLERPGAQQVRYEDLRRNAPGELQRLVLALTGAELPESRAADAADAYIFAKAKAKAEAEKRAAGQDGSAFVREGSVGGWRPYFSSEANDILSSQGYREPMVRLGYPDLG